MKYSRRSFLKTSGALATGLAVGSLPFLKSCASAETEYAPFGLQLYTLRDVIGDDPEGIITQVAEFGYKQIESYEGRQGIFWGMGNTGFKQFMDDLGVSMVSTHANVFQDFEQKVEQLAEIGVPYIVCPFVGPQESIDAYKEMAATFNGLGEIANNAGIKFAYHNHAYTFEEMDGQVPHAIMMDETDPNLVEFQMDIYWVVAGGHDPIEWIRRYPNRFTMSHVKDMGSMNGENESVVLGTGSLDFPTILQAGRENGMVYNIVEQEAYTGTTPIDCIRDNAEYMKELNI
ncbi:MAG: TIM barrel protein [Balneolaceae bacterium]